MFPLGIHSLDSEVENLNNHEKRETGDERSGGIFTRRISKVLNGHLGPNDSCIERTYEELMQKLRRREAGL